VHDITARLGLKRTSRRHRIGKHNAIHKTGSSYNISTPPTEDRSSATANMHKKLGDIRTHVVSEICVPIDRQTDTLIAKNVEMYVTEVSVANVYRC